ncbi:hypothetical protein Nepgr_027876 [Nepenthes gracilis]|uniref:Maltase n=1 Tax=Nepenthes gracilis TaxID=150966 RepID=A0AAD3TBB8_NEPGR|nr:hypothetical protein Nepgr_027876 [Nepenthes gracilis]
MEEDDSIFISSKEQHHSHPLRLHNSLLRTQGAVILVFVVSVLQGGVWNSAMADDDPGCPLWFGYNLQSVEVDSSGRSLTAFLSLKKESSIYGPDIQLLSLIVSLETDDRLRIRITDAEQPRWEIPPEVLPFSVPPNADVNTTSSSQQFLPVNPVEDAQTPAATHFIVSDQNSDLVFALHNTTPFGFTVTRRSSGDVLFNASAEPPRAATFLVFKDQYIQLSSSLPAGRSNLYGLGEHTNPTFRLEENRTQTLWNADILSSNYYLNLYGSQPFYMDVRSAENNVPATAPSGNAHGVLLLNSNGMDIEYTGDRVTYKVIGGIIDLYFFAGPHPEQVMEQYTDFVGRPAPMPYWSFGFHQCRYNYHNVHELEAVVAGYSQAKIPLEVIWSDIDYMDRHEDFSLDPVQFPLDKMRQFIGQLHKNGQRYGVIVEPAIGVNKTYGTFIRGMQEDIFIKRDGVPYMGVVWPGPSYFLIF